jgi:hypothetical protein
VLETLWEVQKCKKKVWDEKVKISKNFEKIYRVILYCKHYGESKNAKKGLGWKIKISKNLKKKICQKIFQKSLL